MKIGYLKAFTDNYIWFLRNNKEIYVIDPGESSAIINYIIANNLELKAILLTHDHHDHVGGVSDILKWFKSVSFMSVPVYGGISSIDGSMCQFASNWLRDGDVIDISDEMTIQVIATPGHTYASICYLVEFIGTDNTIDNKNSENSKNTENGKNIINNKHLFCGDTLFAAGCGRVFTGDFMAMFNSLTRLSRLDPKCYVYPGHEYTLKNLHFAQFIEPDNQLVKQRIRVEEDKLNKLGNTLPVKLAVELKTNPFLRCNNIDLVNSVKQAILPGFSQNSLLKVNSGLECFIRLRELRNNF